MLAKIYASKTKYFGLFGIPAAGTALLPAIFCPACFPAYTTLLSSVGVGFINYEPYLLPLLSIFILISLFGLYFKAQSRRGYLPFLLGIVSSVLILVGKFFLELDAVVYVGISLLIIASIWNIVPKRGQKGTCPI